MSGQSTYLSLPCMHGLHSAHCCTATSPALIYVGSPVLHGYTDPVTHAPLLYIRVGPLAMVWCILYYDWWMGLAAIVFDSLPITSISFYICSTHSGNLRNLQVTLRNLRIPRLRANLQIAYAIHAIWGS